MTGRDIEALSSEIGLAIADVDRQAVKEQLDRLRAAARLVMDFPLTEDVESGDAFAP